MDRGRVTRNEKSIASGLNSERPCVKSSAGPCVCVGGGISEFGINVDLLSRAQRMHNDDYYKLLPHGVSFTSLRVRNQ